MKSQKVIIDIIKKQLDKYLSTLDKETGLKYKIKKSSVFYNIIVQESLTPQQLETVVNILFEDRNETIEQILNRIT